MKLVLVISGLVLAAVVSAFAGDASNYTMEVSSETGSYIGFHASDIDDVQVQADREFEQVMIVLTEAALVRFGEFTSENAGRRITIDVCGNDVWVGHLQTSILGGKFPLFGYDDEEAQRIGDILSGSRFCE